MPWPLVKRLRDLGLDVEWAAESPMRGASDDELIDIANMEGRVLLTRDRDFLLARRRRRIKHGLIYLAEPVKRHNLEALAGNIARALKLIREEPRLAVVSSSVIELYPLRE